VIIGTAGHIDHGKSALVTALTGRSVDRLIEEQRRGITIDLNFAPLLLPGLPPTGVVDVPGHEDLVRTMVAGASGIDLVLLVVDAAQGPEPQTWEHLSIVEQLGIPRGIPVVTKADLVEPDWLELVTVELSERLADSSVDFGAPAVVSAVTKAGIPDLLDRLRAEIQRAPADPAIRPDGFRMPVDRAFSIAGTGTVLTGTPWSGELQVGDAVLLLPSGQAGRVRSLEAYGAQVARAHPGQRAAVGVAGIERGGIHRGETLVSGPVAWRATTALDIELRMLPGAPAPSRRTRVRVLHGTAEVLARVYPREGGFARLALEAPLVARGGDRLVLRRYSPVSTIGGGRILDPAPPRRAEWPAGLGGSAESRAVALIERRARGMPQDELPLLLGVPPEEGSRLLARSKTIRRVGSLLVLAWWLDRARQGAVRAVEEFHAKHPEAQGISLETLRRHLPGDREVIDVVLERLAADGVLVLRDGIVALPDFRQRLAGTPEQMEAIVGSLEAAGLEPPSVPELESQLGLSGLIAVMRRLAGEGRVVAVAPDRYFSKAATERFLAELREQATVGPVTPAALRDRLGITRKFLIPLLEWADRSGATRREGDIRIVL